MAVEGPNGEGAAPAGPVPGTVFDDQVSRIALKGDLGNIAGLSGAAGPAVPAAPAAAPLPGPDYKALGKQEAQQQFAGQVSASGGRYKIDPDALQRVIDKYQDALDTLRQVQVPHDIEPPAPDINSMQYTAAANQSVQAFADTHQAMRTYVQSYVDTLYAIKKAYVEQDTAALDALRGVSGKD